MDSCPQRDDLFESPESDEQEFVLDPADLWDALGPEDRGPVEDNELDAVQYAELLPPEPTGERTE